MEASRTPSVDASASTTSSSVRMLASSTTTTRGVAARVATSCASLLLPSPPAPSMVTQPVPLQEPFDRDHVAVAAEEGVRSGAHADAGRRPARCVAVVAQQLGVELDELG